MQIVIRMLHGGAGGGSVFFTRPVGAGALHRLEDFLVRKKALFAHDMTNLGHAVRGKRFNAHGTKVNFPNSTYS